MASQFEFMHQETQEARVGAIGDLAEDFASETPVESIDQRPVSEADIPAEISADLSAGTLPAAAELPLRALHDASDALRPESATEVIESIGEDQFYDNLLQLVSTPDGGYYSVPIYAWAQLMQYRPSKFEEMGLPMPESWETVMEAAEALHDPDNNQFGIVIGSERDQFTLQCFTPFALANEARVFNTDGEIVFDSDAMVESLEYYAQLHEYTPEGYQTWEPITPLWENGQLHMSSTNNFSLTDITEMEMSWTGSISKETEATFGECMSTTTFAIDNQSEIRAAEEWQKFLRGGDDYSRGNYTRWLHMEPGGFQPVLKGLRERDDYQDNEIVQAWPDELINEQLPAALSSIQRFGFVDGNVFPAIGEITGDFLITDAIREVIDGSNARDVAESYAEEMRSIVE
jgi:multiple sugar transport system substrate-binding protein